MKREKAFLIVLTFLSFFTRFFNLSFPPKVVFDEAHFGLYATKYLSHQYYFDIHPPLGKLLYGLIAFLFRLKPGFDFTLFSNYEDFNFLPLRSLNALLGSLLVILIYFLAKQIGLSERSAILVSTLTLFENSLLVQSRFILLDNFLVFFIFLSLYLFFLEKKFPIFSKNWFLINILLGISLGAAISIKLTGLGILFTVLGGNYIFLKPEKKFLISKLVLNCFLPLFLYFSFFLLHLYLLPNPCFENCGSVLNELLEKNLSVNLGKDRYLLFFHRPPEGDIFQKIKSIHLMMFIGNLAGTGVSLYSSPVYSFPFMIRPILYFQEERGGKISQIWFFGNPIVWWLGVLGLVGFFYLILKNFLLKRKPSPIFCSNEMLILFFGYLTQFLPLFKVRRFVLLYHYLPSLIYSLFFFAIFFEEILKNFSPRSQKIFYGLLFILVFSSFLFFSPFTYGTFLSPKQIKIRRWLSTWEILP